MKRHGFCLGVCFLFLACGGGSSGDPKSAAMFVGVWSASGQTTQNVTCGTQSENIPLWGKVTISLTAPNSGEIITQADNGCVLHWVCEGDTATVETNDTCTVGVPLTSGEWQATFTKGSLTLGSNLLSLQDNGSAIYTVNGGTQNCTFEQNGSFTDQPDGGN